MRKFTEKELSKMNNIELSLNGYVRIPGYTKSDGTKVKAHVRELFKQPKVAVSKPKNRLEIIKDKIKGLRTFDVGGGTLKINKDGFDFNKKF